MWAILSIGWGPTGDTQEELSKCTHALCFLTRDHCDSCLPLLLPCIPYSDRLYALESETQINTSLNRFCLGSYC